MAVIYFFFTLANSFKFHPQMTFFSLVTERLIFSRPKLPEVEANEKSEQLWGGWEKGAFEVAQTSLGGGRRPTAGQNTLVPP